MMEMMLIKGLLDPKGLIADVYQTKDYGATAVRHSDDRGTPVATPRTDG